MKKKDVVANSTLELDREEIKNRDMFNDIMFNGAMTLKGIRPKVVMDYNDRIVISMENIE